MLYLVLHSFTENCWFKVPGPDALRIYLKMFLLGIPCCPMWTQGSWMMARVISRLALATILAKTANPPLGGVNYPGRISPTLCFSLRTPLVFYRTGQDLFPLTFLQPPLFVFLYLSTIQTEENF